MVGMSVLADDLRRRSDDELVRLLRARPDLATPAPSSVLALAARAATRPSVERALAVLDRHHLDVAEAVVALTDVRPAPRAIPLSAVSAALGLEVTPAVARLLDLALLTGTHDALAPVPALVDALGPYPAGLGPSVGSPGTEATPDAAAPPTGPAALAAALHSAPDAARRVLDVLTWGPPVGTVDPNQPGPGSAWLLERGLLLAVSPSQVVLPREVALAARGGRTHRATATTAPVPPAETRAPAVIAAESSRAADEIVRRITALLELWDQEPPTVLRTGGVGTRELRRVGTALELDAVDAAFVVELAAMAGLVGPWSGSAEPTWLPTGSAERWQGAGTATRWAALGRSWLASPRAPWLVGTRAERGDPRAALARGLERGWAPALRRGVLDALAAWPLAAAPSAAQVSDLLHWRSPRAHPPAEIVAAVLHEVALLGLTGAGALSASGRALLAHASEPDAEGALVAALEADLPPLVEEIVVQGDLTALVPGRPSPGLAELLEAAADVESRGAALTVRFSARSIRRALDRGLDPDHLVAALRAHSRVPLPQPLEYLVSDVARRHGALRIGAVASYLRSPDAGALAELLADPRVATLELRQLAPTVLVSPEPAARVLEVLRACDVGAAVEGPDGVVLPVEGRHRRLGGPHGTGEHAARGGSADHGHGAHALADEALAALVAQMRTGDEWAAAVAGPGGVASAPAHVVEVLRDAAAAGREVRLEVAGASGSLRRLQVRPVSVDVGRLRAVDPARESEITIAVHRIASVVAVASEVAGPRR